MFGLNGQEHGGKAGSASPAADGIKGSYLDLEFLKLLIFRGLSLDSLEFILN